MASCAQHKTGQVWKESEEVELVGTLLCEQGLQNKFCWVSVINSPAAYHIHFSKTDQESRFNWELNPVVTAGSVIYKSVR